MAGGRALGSQTCSEPDCDGKVVGRGWCRRHYMAARASGLFQPDPQIRPKCSIENCENPNEARKMCVAHYTMWRKYGDPLAPDGHVKHGHTINHKPSPEYRCWVSMIGRCTNSALPAFKDYGGRGISVCDRWRNSFAAFLEDMGPRPSLQHSLDRYPDNNGNYEPSNVRWATQKEQTRNMRTNRLLEVDGRVQCLNAWAEEVGIQRGTIKNRLRRGWDAERAIFTPVVHA